MGGEESHSDEDTADVVDDDRGDSEGRGADTSTAGVPNVQSSGIANAQRALDRIDFSALRVAESLDFPALRVIENMDFPALRVAENMHFPALRFAEQIDFSALNAIPDLNFAAARLAQSMDYPALQLAESIHLPAIRAAETFDSPALRIANNIDFSGSLAAQRALADFQPMIEASTIAYSSPIKSEGYSREVVSPSEEIPDDIGRYEGSLVSDIESYISQVRAQIAYQRTYDALTAYGEHIDNRTLVFIVAQLLNTLPVVIAGPPGLAMSIFGSALATLHYIQAKQYEN